MADNDFTVVWTAVPFSTAIAAHPQKVHPRVWSDGWLQFDTESGPSTIWLPGERRAEPKAVAATASRLVIGSISGAMTIIALY
jgi:hypothetical protein